MNMMSGDLIAAAREGAARRTEVVTIRLTAREKAEAMEAARRTGVALSDAGRAALAAYVQQSRNGHEHGDTSTGQGVDSR